jgi:isopropylmalate/homocitrate/citramalate synthase
VKHARRPRIHTFVSTSPLHMKYKLQKDPSEVLEMVTAQVTRARNFVEDVEWSAEDGTRIAAAWQQAPAAWEGQALAVVAVAARRAVSSPSQSPSSSRGCF